MKTYKFDTHVHTMETSRCGRVKGIDVARLYKDTGYQGIAITDHYYKEYFDILPETNWEDKVDIYLAGYREAVIASVNLGLDVILGMEIRFDENFNDYLVFGIDEGFLKNYKELYNLGLEKFKNLVEGRNMLIYQAHPFRKDMIAAEPELLDGVEVFNGNPRHNSHNDLALAFARANNLKMLSGSDFHQPEDLARGGIVVENRIKCPEELVAVLRKEENIRLITS
jgi:predicted metal-dependent phosphoesterase TrpH